VSSDSHGTWFAETFAELHATVGVASAADALGSLDALGTEPRKRLPWVFAQRETPTLEAGERLDDRYVVGDLLGKGGFGAVYEATDRITDERVAIKLLTLDNERESLRMEQEAALLRLLVFPGVVQYRGAGRHDGRLYVVMEHVDGAPFPGSLPRTWAGVAEAWIALVETVARVHGLGILHRDLKPANVLVKADGQPIVLDFGISRHDELSFLVERDGAIVGTPAYLAPEQLVAGAASVHSDLYALGLMLYQALTGVVPGYSQKFQEILRRRTTEVPERLDVLADVPEDVADIVASLLSIEPGARPTVPEILPRLRRALPSWQRIRSALGQAADYEALFAGPDRFHHLREDGAAMLRRRAGDDLDVAADVLASWQRERLWAWQEGRVALPRTSLSMLEHLPDPLRPDAAAMSPVAQHLSRSEPEEAATVAIAEASCLFESGELQRAWVVSSVGHRIAHRHAFRELATALRHLMARTALVMQRPGPLAVSQLTAFEAQDEPLAALLGAALSVLDGTADRAAVKPGVIAGTGDERVDVWQYGLRVHVGMPREEWPMVMQELQRAQSEASDPSVRARLSSLFARMLFRDGRFSEAADHLVAAWEAASIESDRIALANRAAIALLEAGRLDEARDMAQWALREFDHYRWPLGEALFVWVDRMAAYRQEAALPIDEALEPEAFQELGDAHALHLVVDAATAWRAHDHLRAAHLATQASRSWPSPRHPGVALCRALATAAGATEFEPQVLLDAAAKSCRDPIDLQTAALAVHAGASLEDAQRERFFALGADFRSHAPDIRREVLSVSECLAFLSKPTME
jgi:serine/threonine protein kinase